LGQPTFVGSSGRVFPQVFKASPLLRAWLRRLDQAGVQIALRIAGPAGMQTAASCFQAPDGQREIDATATVLALGGASWPRLGSDGAWAETLTAKGVKISPLVPSNSGFTVAWSDIFRDRFEDSRQGRGAIVRCVQRSRRSHYHPQRHRRRRDLCAVADLREAILHTGRATLQIALRPDLEMKDLVARLSVPKGKQSLSNFLP